MKARGGDVLCVAALRRPTTVQSRHSDCAGDGVDRPVGFGRKSPVSLFAKTVRAMPVLLREMPATADEKLKHCRGMSGGV